MSRVPAHDTLQELVVCSLEPWDEIWRRNQFLVDELLRRKPHLRVLFVEPPADPLFDLGRRRRPQIPSVRRGGYGGRLAMLTPLKPLPRRLGSATDRLLRAQVRLAARLLRFSRPALWLNDVTYAPLIKLTRWPSVYDITDDWLLAPFAERELERLAVLDRIALEADAVVVCSRTLAESRGRHRAVTLIPNGVDVEHFRRPYGRPADLPSGRVAVYVGTLHESRLDVDLVVELAQKLPFEIVLVGPNSLGSDSRSCLASAKNVHQLGARPYDQVPAYLQHADVIIVPHLVNGFTESLDPIKAYEALAVDVPVVATPVAGFRDLTPAVVVAPRDTFAEAVRSAVTRRPAHIAQPELPSWRLRAEAFELVLSQAREAREGYGEHRSVTGSIPSTRQ